MTSEDNKLNPPDPTIPPTNDQENTEGTQIGQIEGGDTGSSNKTSMDYYREWKRSKNPPKEEPKIESEGTITAQEDGGNLDQNKTSMDYYKDWKKGKLEKAQRESAEKSKAEQEKQDRWDRQIKLHEGLEKEPGDSYDAWSDEQYEFIKGQVPNYLGELPDDDDKIKDNIKEVLNDSWEFFNSKSNLAKNMRTGITKKLLEEGSFNSMAKPMKMMNDLSDLEGLYWVALNSDNPDRRKKATKRINELQDRYGDMLKNLDDDKKQLLKGQILFTEYYRALDDTMKYPGETMIWITPRAGRPPLIASYETGNPGEYDMTLDEFRSDMLKLAMGKQTDSVGLKSGFVQTKRYKNGNIYSFDFNDLFDPMRYIKLSENDKEKLRKEGLNIYYHDRQEEIKKELQNINNSILVLSRAMLAKTDREKKEAEKEIKALEERQQELQKELKQERDKYDQAKAEQEAIDKHRDKVTKTEEEKKVFENKIQEDYYITTSGDSRDIINERMKAGVQVADFGNLVSSVADIATDVGDEAARKAMKALQQKWDDHAARLAESGVRQLDRNVTADWMEEMARVVSKNPALKMALKGVKYGANAASIVFSTALLAKDMYDSWKNAETFYEQLKDKNQYETYLSTFDNSTQMFLKDKIKRTGNENMMGFYQVQLDDQLPKLEVQEVTLPNLPSKEETQRIKAKLRSAEVDIIHSAIQGYKNRTGKNKYGEISKGEILKMLGIPAFREPVTDKEIKMMESSPWLLPFYKSLHPSTTTTNRLMYLKSLSGNRELNKKFKEFER